jgi:NTE family protein
VAASPDLLVLGSGGVLGDVWMTGVVAGLIRSGRVDPREAARFTGTSAGSIVATRLAAGEDLDTLAGRYVRGPVAPAVTTPPEAVGADRGYRPVGRLLAGHGPAGRFIRRRALAAIPPGRQELRHLKRDMEALAPEWPERLHIAAFNADTGDRVVFSRDHDCGLTVSEAVQASCAIPSVFSPVQGPGGRYVDGGVWSPVNLDAVPVDPGSPVICLTPSGSYQGARGLRRRAAGKLFRSIVRGEVARMRGRGVRVANIVPDPAASAAIGPNRMAGGREAGVYRAGLAQGIALGEPLAAWLAAPAGTPVRA